MEDKVLVFQAVEFQVELLMVNQESNHPHMVNLEHNQEPHMDNQANQQVPMDKEGNQEAHMVNQANLGNQQRLMVNQERLYYLDLEPVQDQDQDLFQFLEVGKEV